MFTAEGELQTRAWNLQIIARKHIINILSIKTKSFGNVWEQHTKLKIAINDSNIEEV
jgi:hypothetical protein